MTHTAPRSGQLLDPHIVGGAPGQVDEQKQHSSPLPNGSFWEVWQAFPSSALAWEGIIAITPITNRAMATIDRIIDTVFKHFAIARHSS